MADTFFLPLVRSGNVNAVSFCHKPPVKGGKRRGHAALRRSVSSLAIICALGAAVLPGNAEAQAVSGGNGGNGTAMTGGSGGAGAAASGTNANSGGNGGFGYGANGMPGQGGANSGGAAGMYVGVFKGTNTGGGGGGGGTFGNGGYGGGGGSGPAFGGTLAEGGGGGSGGGGGGGGGDVGMAVTSATTITSTISGGNGGNGGNGAFNASSSFSGYGGGGGGGGAGIYAQGPLELTNTSGTITGGYGGMGGDGFRAAGGGGGGAGIAGSGFTLNNQGSVAGGIGGLGGTQENDGGYGGAGGNGGAGIAANGFIATNSGSISGGAGGAGGYDTLLKGQHGAGGVGGAGGAGISGSGFTVTSSDKITGGAGGAGGKGGNDAPAGLGGAGGAGIAANGFTATNSGSISGGAGGTGGAGTGMGGMGGTAGNGGAGGAGISGSGFTVTNSGTITGGAGGAGGTSDPGGIVGTDGAGGVGVVGTGDDTVVTSGAIAGGDGGDAIDFSGGGNTLVLEQGNSFIGNVVSTSGATDGGDTLALGGSTNASFNVSQIGGSGEFQGFNNFEKTGSSTWILTGSGGQNWTLIDGTLQGDTLSLQGNIAFAPGRGDTTGVVFDVGSGDANNPTSAGTYAGIISGNGSLTKIDNGTLTLTGVNTYTGATTITEGTLALSGLGSIANSSGVTDNGTFDISATTNGASIASLAGSGIVTLGNQQLTLTNGNGSFMGTFSGTGNLLIQGTGIQVFDGANTSFKGTTEIASGTLEVGDIDTPGAVLGGGVTVDAAGTLRGHGTIGGNVVNNGVVFPGGSGTGILTVNDNFTQTSTGTLNIEITPSTVPGTGFDQLQVGGTASLAGTLAVQVDNGTVGSQYDILHAAGGVSGSFGAATINNPALAAFITPVVSISADDVTLELTPTPDGPNPSNDLAFSTGRIYAASNFAQNGALLNALNAPLGGTGTAGTDTDQGYWLNGLGAFGQANGFDFNEEGFVIGKGFAVSPNLTLGGGISNVYTVTSGGASSVNGTSVGAEVYGLYTAGQATISASVMAGHLGTNISRGLPTLGETAKATSTGAYEAAALHLQYNLLSGSRFFVAPYVSVSYLHTGLGGATETGAGILDLHYDAMSTSLAELGAGVSGGFSMPVKYGTLTAWAGLGGTGTLGNPHVRDTEGLGSFSAGETALAAPVGAFTPAVGVELTGRGPWRLAAAWGGQFGSATSAENFSLEARYVW
jgi:hypothetical protein